MLKRVKVGDKPSASQWNELIDIVNNNLTSNPTFEFGQPDYNTSNTTTPIEPNFIFKDDVLYVSIIGSYIINNSGENIIPKFKDSIIGIDAAVESSDNPLIDIDDPTRGACFKALTNGSYEIRLAYDGGGSATVDCNLVGDAVGDYKLYTFTVNNKIVLNFVNFMETGLFVSSTQTEPLDVLTSPQAYHGEIDTELNDNQFNVWVRFGTIANVVADNWQDEITVTKGSEKIYIYAEVKLDQNDVMGVTSWEIKQDTTEIEAIVASDYPATSLRPSKFKVLLGTFVKDSDAESDNYTLINEGGSMQLLEYVNQTTSSAGAIGYRRSIYVER